MLPILFRVVLLTGGIACGELGLDSLAHGADIAPVQIALAVVLLAVGSAGFVVPLLRGSAGKEGSRDA